MGSSPVKSRLGRSSHGLNGEGRVGAGRVDTQVAPCEQLGGSRKGFAIHHQSHTSKQERLDSTCPDLSSPKQPTQATVLHPPLSPCHLAHPPARPPT